MEEKRHSVRMENRKDMHLTGIESVISFREDGAQFESCLGICQITGIGLHMEKLDLDSGEVYLTGTVISLYYPEETAKEDRGLFRRIFS